MGGEIRTCAAVSNLVETDGLISAVELEDGETIECQNVISNAHPSYTLSLVKESKVLRHSYINRIKNCHFFLRLFICKYYTLFPFF